MTKTFRRLTIISFVIGAIATITYSLGASIVVRFIDPTGGAWWNGREFYVMEGAATTCGLLVGILVVRRILREVDLWLRAENWAFLASAFLLAPLTALVSHAARPILGGLSFHRREYLIGMFHYDVGSVLENLISGVEYAVKSMALAVLCGIGISAGAFAVTMILKFSGEVSEKNGQGQEI